MDVQFVVYIIMSQTILNLYFVILIDDSFLIFSSEIRQKYKLYLVNMFKYNFNQQSKQHMQVANQNISSNVLKFYV